MEGDVIEARARQGGGRLPVTQRRSALSGGGSVSVCGLGFSRATSNNLLKKMKQNRWNRPLKRSLRTSSACHGLYYILLYDIHVHSRIHITHIGHRVSFNLYTICSVS